MTDNHLYPILIARRHWILLTAGVLTGIAVGLVGRTRADGAAREPDREERLVQKVEQLGGAVSRFAGGPRVGIYLNGTAITDEELKHLSALATLRNLDLSDTQVSDAGVKHLVGLGNLRHLDLSGTRITGAGLKHLSNLTKLTSLELNNTQVSDDGLTHLSGLTDLVGLSLGNTRVSNAGRKELTNTLPRVSIYP